MSAIILIAHVCEIFSSIQGEGKHLGRRQIFLRFAGCNLNCNYCDTPKSKHINQGKIVKSSDLYNKIECLKTDDLHSISLTGGEPLLQADFIKYFLNEYDLSTLLETNGSLPQEIEKIIDYLHYASVDVKLPEHHASLDWENLFKKEIESINLLIDGGINTYCKVVLLPSTKKDTIGFIASRIREEVHEPSKLDIVLQPSSPLENWKQQPGLLFELSEETGKYLEVLTIPQVHKLLNIR
jgi:organic radical activating enzyme